MDSKNHWQKVYTTKPATEVSWFQEHARLPLKLIREVAPHSSLSIIDVGGGASTLVDDLLEHGYENLTVLDLSAAALETAKARLGDRADSVHWIAENLLEIDFSKDAFDVWHDRAVFHFLTTTEERLAYVNQVLRAVKLGGTIVIATFSEDGPTQCSGLPVMRYSAQQLQSEFGFAFQLLSHQKESHYTPGGNEQRFIYCVFKKVSE